MKRYYIMVAGKRSEHVRLFCEDEVLPRSMAVVWSFYAGDVYAATLAYSAYVAGLERGLARGED